MPVWSHGGIVCTGEIYKDHVKMTFAKGAVLRDPSRLFNSSLDGNVRRAIDIQEGDKINEAGLKDLIRTAVALNLKGTNKSKFPRARRLVYGSPVHERSLRTFHLLDALPKETAEINEGWRRGRICIYFAERDAQDLQEIVRWMKAYGDLPPVRNG